MVMDRGGKIATNVVDSLKAQPVLLVIVFLNAIMVAGAAWSISSIAGFVHEERMTLVDRCLPPPQPRSPPT
jgi:hypothetical protein